MLGTAYHHKDEGMNEKREREKERSVYLCVCTCRKIVSRKRRVHSCAFTNVNYHRGANENTSTCLISNLAWQDRYNQILTFSDDGHPLAASLFSEFCLSYSFRNLPFIRRNDSIRGQIMENLQIKVRKKTYKAIIGRNRRKNCRYVRIYYYACAWCARARPFAKFQ